MDLEEDTNIVINMNFLILKRRTCLFFKQMQFIFQNYSKK